MNIPQSMQFSIAQVAGGLVLAVIIAWIAWRAGALSHSGAVAAVFTGTAVFGLGGLAWAAPLLTFFISSSALSRLFGGRKASLSEKFSKGHRRDLAQVLANGGFGALLAAASAFFPHYTRLLWYAYAGTMAAVNADTWATELGVLSTRPPRLITTFKPVERGASGAVSLPGSLAALGGAALVGVVAASLNGLALPGAGPDLWLFIAASVGGVFGSFFDSLLGATVQAIYCCPQCQKETERHPLHTCGTETVLQRGWEWMNNDVVNFLASVVGGMIAWLFAYGL